MKKQLCSLIITIYLAIPAIGMADQNYQIELIIFSHPISKGISQEQWPQDEISLPNTTNTVTLESTTGNDEVASTLNDQTQINTDTPILLPKTQWKLISEDQHLRRHPDYHVLLHEAWMQTIPRNANNPTRIHLYGGQAYQRNGKTLRDSSQDTPTSFEKAKTWQINGVMSLFLNRYINTQFNLAFAMPSSQFETLNHNPHSAKPSQ